MPVPNLEQIRKREGTLRTKIAELGDSPDPARRRTLRKSLKRVQRRRREVVATQERLEKDKAKRAAASGAAASAPAAAAAPESSE